jgi:hypothetical protein
MTTGNGVDARCADNGTKQLLFNYERVINMADGLDKTLANFSRKHHALLLYRTIA